MWSLLLGVCSALVAFFKSPSGKHVLKAIDGAIPIIKRVNRRGFFQRDDAKDARLLFDQLMQDKDFPLQFLKQKQAYYEVKSLLQKDPKFPDKEITASNIMKIVELAHGSFKANK